MRYLTNLIASGLTVSTFVFSIPTGLEAKVESQEPKIEEKHLNPVPEPMSRARATELLLQGINFLSNRMPYNAYSSLTKTTEYFERNKNPNGDLEYIQSTFYLGRACWFLGERYRKTEIGNYYFRATVTHLTNSLNDYNLLIKNSPRIKLPNSDDYLMDLHMYVASSHFQLGDVKAAFPHMLQLIKLSEGDYYVDAFSDFASEVSDNELAKLVQQINNTLNQRKAQKVIDKVFELRDKKRYKQ